jgi:hypothetical protein
MSRPRIKLVESRTFRADNQRHRRVLLLDPLPVVGHPDAEELTRIAERYRRDPYRPHGTWWAQRFEAVVKS